MNPFRYCFNLIRLHRDSSRYWRSKGAVIGENCDIHTNAELGSEPYLITIGSHVRINSGVQIITHDGGVWVLRALRCEYKNIDLFKRVFIGNNVHIGTNAVIMQGVSIGNNCIVGVGAVVTKNIPDNSIAVGIPAKVIETIDEYLKKNKNNFVFTKEMSQKEKKKYLENIKI